jgi:hypothetical protein
VLANGIPSLSDLPIQQLLHEKVMYAPLMEPAILAGYGPRVAEPVIGLITNMAASAPDEELWLKGT